MAANRTSSLIGGTVLRKAFGIQYKTLRDRKVEPKQQDPLQYCLYEVVDKCRDLIANHVVTEITDDGIDELDKEKRRQEIRKLTIENDIKEGQLVSAIEVEIAITKGLRAIADSLDAIPVQFVMNNPDVSPTIKDSLNKTLIDVRNKLANTGINYD